MKQFIVLSVFLGLACGASLPGSNPCTWGPSYWCRNTNQAEECNSLSYCSERYWHNSSAPLIGEDKCTEGPAYWCSGADTITECNATEYCSRQGAQNEDQLQSKDLNTEPVGTDKCTEGPAYWCSGEDTISECNAQEYCAGRLGNQGQGAEIQAMSVESDTPVGQDKCTWGPSYWCSSMDAANECGMVDHCQGEWSATDAPTTTDSPIGGDKCTWGPSYWCSGANAAQACNATDFCKETAWNTKQV